MLTTWYLWLAQHEVPKGPAPEEPESGGVATASPSPGPHSSQDCLFNCFIIINYIVMCQCHLGKP